MDVAKCTKLQSLFFAAILLLNGCASGIKTSSGKPAELMDPITYGKSVIGLCSNPFNFENGTRFVGTDASKPPQERKIEKQEAWNRWLAVIENNKKEILSEQRYFYIDHIVYFNADTNDDGKSDFASIKPFEYRDSTDRGRYENKIPRYLFLDVQQVAGEQLLPEGLLDPNQFKLSDGELFSAMAKLDLLRRKAIEKEFQKRYIPEPGVKSHLTIRKHAHTTGSYTESFSQDFVPGGSFGFKLVPGDWYNYPESIIKRKDDNNLYDDDLYIDWNGIDAFQKLGFYPDAQGQFVKITYIFSLKSCDHLSLLPSVHEIIISTPEGVELNRVIRIQ